MYQALYRKYRPKTFDDILGQNHVTKILKNQVKSGNIGHAYLFSGTRGTGKTSAAKVLARAVNCLNPVDGNPCNECSVCKGILDESLMDVIEMDAASNRKIEDIRELKEKIIYPPSVAKYKVYIIDEVHMLTNEAFNALLKTLEEPPKHLIFILATTEPEKLPQTILSRCQRFDFKRITNNDIIYNMQTILDSMDITVEKRALELVARNSDGAMRDALSLLDQLIAYDSNNITYEDCINILGITSSDLIFELVDAINERDIGKSLEILERVILEGKDIQQFVKDLTYHFRNLMISKVSKNPEELIFTEDVERYIAQSKKFELDDILKCLEILRDTDSNVKWALQPRIVLELAIIKMIEKGEVTKEDKNVSQHEKEEKESIKEEVTKKISKNVEVEKKDSKTVSSADEEKFSLKYVKAQWPKIMQIIKSKKISIYALIMEGEVQRVDDNRIVITYKEGFEFHKNAVNSPQNKEFLEQVLSEYFSTPIELVFLMSNQIDEMKEEVKDIPKEKTKEEKIQEVIDFFGEDLVEIIEEE